MRGIDEPSKDLETLKQILEALQLKGLLHSKKASNQINSKNFVYDQSFKSLIVVMKPFRSSSSTHHAARFRNESPLLSSGFMYRVEVCRNGEVSSAVSPRRNLQKNVRS
ncbi:hypothetical protein ACFX15_034725 [Malus domestica]